MLDFMILFGLGAFGVMFAIIGSVIQIGRRITEPKRETQQKIDDLEKEIKDLKNSN